MEIDDLYKPSKISCLNFFGFFRNPIELILILFFTMSSGSRSLYSQLFTDVTLETGLFGSATGFYGNGVTFYDWNDDGFDDIVITYDQGAPLFFLNQDGVFIQRFYAGLEEEVFNDINYPLASVKSLNWVDINNDRFPDLAINRSEGPFMLFLNDGEFNFTNISSSSGIYQDSSMGYAQSWADYDKDGYLDLYISNYQIEDHTNYLYRNNGNNTFTDVTEQAGVGNGNLFTLISAWIDYDLDSWPDLWVFNDRQVYPNSLYRNNGNGTFVEVTIQAGVDDYFEPMSASVGDFNNDGWPDMYSTDGQVNRLYKNNGDGTFENVAAETGTQLLTFSWGAIWTDFDGNMTDDLVIATGEDAQTPTLFYLSNQGGTFSPVIAPEVPSESGWTYSIAKGDYNNDGIPDIVRNSKLPLQAALLKCNSQGQNYLKVMPIGISSNKDAIGARLELWVDGIRQTRFVMSGEQYLSQNSQWQFFSLGDNVSCDSLIIHWPLGFVDKWYNLEANQNLLVYEGSTLSMTLESERGYNFCIGDTVVLDAGEWDYYFWYSGDTTRITYVTETSTVGITVSVDGFYAASDVLYFTFNNPAEYQIFETPINCHGNNDGSLAISYLNEVFVDSTLWGESFLGSEFPNLGEGEYQFSFTDSSGCFLEGQYYLDEPDMLTLSTETNITAEGQECSGTWNGVALPSGGTPPYNYQWTFTVAGQANPFFETIDSSFTCVQNEENIIAVCIVTDANNCSSELEVFLQSTSLNKSINKEIVLTPNPFNDKLFFNNLPKTAEISFFTLTGEEVYSFLLQTNTGFIDTSLLPSGMYILNCELMDGVIFRKPFMKQTH